MNKESECELAGVWTGARSSQFGHTGERDLKFIARTIVGLQEGGQFSFKMQSGLVNASGRREAS